MLVPELGVWKCIYCETENDFTNWKCHNCGKKKVKPITLKRILSKRKKDQELVAKKERQQVIQSIEPGPQQEEKTDLVFDLSKLKIDKDVTK